MIRGATSRKLVGGWMQEHEASPVDKSNIPNTNQSLG